MRLQDGFMPNKDLLRDCSRLDPKKYEEIVTSPDRGFLDTALTTFSKLACIQRTQLLKELRQFAVPYNSFTVE